MGNSLSESRWRFLLTSSLMSTKHLVARCVWAVLSDFVCWFFGFRCTHKIRRNSKQRDFCFCFYVFAVISTLYGRFLFLSIFYFFPPFAFCLFFQFCLVNMWKRIPVLRDSLAAILWKICRARGLLFLFIFCLFFSTRVWTNGTLTHTHSPSFSV